MVGEAAALEPATPEVDGALQALLALLRRARRDRRWPPAQGAVADLAGLHPVAGAGIRLIHSDRKVAGEDQVDVLVADLGVRSVIAAAAPRQPRGSVVEGRLADHLDVDLALEALDLADQDVLGLVIRRRAPVRLEVVVLAPVPESEPVADDDPAGAGHPGGLEDVRPGDVAAADRRGPSPRRPPPQSGAPAQNRAEAGLRLEP